MRGACIFCFCSTASAVVIRALCGNFCTQNNRLSLSHTHTCRALCTFRLFSASRICISKWEFHMPVKGWVVLLLRCVGACSVFCNYHSLAGCLPPTAERVLIAFVSHTARKIMQMSLISPRRAVFGRSVRRRARSLPPPLRNSLCFVMRAELAPFVFKRVAFWCADEK